MFWFFPEIERLEKEVAALTYSPKLVFYGSSTFTRWTELRTIFKEYDAVNLAFGGSSLAACTWFFERNFKNITAPESIVIYAGDNDLAEGRHPEEVVLFLENLIARIRAKYGNISVAYVSIKPSPDRVHLLESIRYTNAKAEELLANAPNCHFISVFDKMLTAKGRPNPLFFIEDGLHLNTVGYKIWLDVLKDHPEILPEKMTLKK